MYCLLIGTGIGWALALLLTPETLADLALVGSKPLLAFPSLPFDVRHITFDLGLVLPFIIISICATLKSLGNLLAAQQISEPELTEPDLRPISYGLMADGLITSLSGLVGALAVDTSSSNVGLAAATRACSRWICIAAGVLFMMMAFMPKIGAAIATIPKPVLGASLIFAGSFMICTGLREMMKETFDTRAIFTVGISIIIGLSTGFMPELYARFPEFMKSFFSDPLATTTILSVVLYQIFYFDLLYLKKKTGTP
jgi:NCS2 family nucleobase:cation symporter-2